MKKKSFVCKHEKAKPDDWLCGECGQLIGDPPRRTITICIASGKVAEVKNLPDGYDWDTIYEGD